jgi:hypothetical protein
MRNPPNLEVLPRIGARQRRSVQTRLDALWSRAQRLAEEIKRARQVGGSTERPLAVLAALRRRSWQLAELGEAIGWQYSEATSVDHGRGGKRWRPTVAEPF